MCSWIRLVLLCVALCGGVAQAAGVAGHFTSDIGEEDYDCAVTLAVAGNAAADAAVRLSLEWGNGKSHTLVTVTRQAVELSAVEHRKPTLCRRLPVKIAPGASRRLHILRRGDTVAVMLDDTLVGHGTVPRSSGAQAGVVADAGWTASDAELQRIEPVVFSDDFMRSPAEPSSPWRTVSGAWQLKSAWDQITHGRGVSSWLSKISHDPAQNRAQNPFAWVGRSTAGTAAVCTTGNPFWEDYTFSVAVQPGEDGACGVLVNLSEAGRGLLVRWTPANSAQRGGNRLSLCRYPASAGGKDELAGVAGGYVPGQWARLTVISSLQRVRVLVDGHERLSLPMPTPWRGAVGLYAEGTSGTVFDDVTVYGRTLDLDLLYEMQQERLAKRFVEDNNGMKDWALRLGEWIPDAADKDFHWFRQDLFGAHTWMVLTVKPAAGTSGELWMTLNGDGTTRTSGYRAALYLVGNPPLPTYTLYRNEQVLQTVQTAPLAAGSEYTLRLRRHGARLWLEVDGETMLDVTDPAPLAGLRPAYRNQGAAFAKIGDLQVLGTHTQDYPFTDAPASWLTQGAWEPSIRWSCTPNWSFLAGWSRGDAVLWQKQRFAGDHSIEAYVGSKMEYPRETDTYYNRQGHFAVTLCSDGDDPRHGYALIYGYPGKDGTPLERAVLLRHGTVVAETPIIKRAWASNHRVWFYLQLNKRGATVTAFVRVAQETYQLTFTDPQPLAEGIPAVWTSDNAMTVARVRLDYAQAPKPRTDPFIVIDQPWFPEWANLQETLRLPFRDSWSTSGRPVSWSVLPAAVPAGDERAVSVARGELRFTPQQPGPHWYQVRAVDRTYRSEPFHLSLPVFNPALRRDDAHALVLYRFDEGRGTVVRDRSAVAPALDLTITPDPLCFTWLPGQGVRTSVGVKALKSAAAADKLLAIKQAKACTMEVWASADTLYGASGGFGCFFSWEPAAAPTPHLGFGYYTANFLVPTGGIPFAHNNASNLAAGFVTSLHHFLVTWDGTTTTIYRDGKPVAAKAVAWNLDTWAAGAPLYVANQPNDGRAFSGALYLLAIHNRCFTPDEVQRQYQAGPSAK